MVALRKAVRSKTTLPLIRKKLKECGSIAVRGSNELHEVNQKKSDHFNGNYNPFHNSVVVNLELLNKESTRNFISIIGNSVIFAMNYAFEYSGFKYELDKKHHPIITYNEKNRPTIAVSFNSRIGSTQEMHLGDSYRLKGTNSNNFTGEKSTDIHAQSENTHYITIDKEDIVDLKKAWALELSKQKEPIVGPSLWFANFLNNFLARRIITKALKAQNISKKSSK